MPGSSKKTLFGCADNFRVQKVLAAAKFAGIELSVTGDAPPAAANTPLSDITPALCDGSTQLFGSHGIMWYLGGENLRGCEKQPEVIQWLEFAESKVLPHVLGWVLPCISVMANDKKGIEASKSELMRLLGLLNDYLLPRTFLVGERITHADICLAFDLLPAFQHVIESGARKDFCNVTRWFNTVMHQPEVISVVGDIQLCEKTAQFEAAKFKEYQAHVGGEKSAATPKQEGKKDKKKAPQKEEKKEEKEEMDATEEALAEEPKKKDPFDQFEKGTWNFDEFKRVYSNEDTVTKAIPYFWENFDKEHYSIWYCEYKFPEELKLIFMSANLVGGMFQRLDKMRKNSFGSMALFGTDNNSTISGIWFWRGHELAFTLSQDWQIDFESYEWKKLDPDDPATKKMVNEYFAWEGDFDGKTFNQGKIFK